MERQTLYGSPIGLSLKASRLLGVDARWILKSFTVDRDWSRPRYFEKYGQLHLTLIVTTVKA